MDIALSRIAPVMSSALAFTGVAHAFFTRQGGASSGIYASLNTGIGSHDDRDLVLENRARAARHLGAAPDRLATPHQVHGTDCAVVEAPWPVGEGPRADAVATRVPGILVGVGTADCGAILFADAEAGVVAAAHAGWKGALAGVLESTVAVMESLGARRSRIAAVLGPTISANAYEVGPEFVARFTEADLHNDAFFRAAERDGHAWFDLPAYIVNRLRAAGVGRAESVDLCTYADEARFFSYRRATHRGEPDYGRQLAGIMLA
jgi:YfiH family protein